MASPSQNLVAAAPSSRPIGLAELEQALRAADPASLLVSSRLLRRVIKQDRRIGGIGLRVPHRKTYVIGREELLAIVDLTELDLPPTAELAETVILIARPSAQRLALSTAEEALTKYWQLLFHARVHLVFDQLLIEGKLGPALVAERIHAIGQPEFDEIRGVLRQEDYLLPPKTDIGTYVELAAVYWELRYFTPGLLASYFPGIQDFARIDEILKEDVDAYQIFSGTRLPGAADPMYLGANHEPPAAEPESQGPPSLKPSERTCRELGQEADRLDAEGNQVAAAILRTRAARYATAEQARAARVAARADVARLAERLRSALDFSGAEGDEWTKSLLALLEHSARTALTAEAKILYDLQKVCVDHERGLYALDLVGWAASLGRRSIKRLLPGQGEVLIAKHLRTAAGRVAATRLPSRVRLRLESLLHSAVHRAEANLRARFRPAIERSLDEVKLVPQNVPEQVARKKLIDELLDLIVERGFLTMGDLRDALSRNNLKLPDITGLDQWLWGDQLLQADRRLARALRGVYRRGEIYLRVPQRLSSLAFGTPVGRFFTQHIAIPFGGAFLLLEGLHHIAGHVAGWLGYARARLPDDVATPDRHALSGNFIIALLLLGMFIWGLIHVRAFRALSLQAVWSTGRALRAVFVALPASLASLPWVRALLASPYFRLAQRYFFKPLAVAAILAALFVMLTGRGLDNGELLGLFFGVNLLVNSRVGRKLDEMVTDWTLNVWHLFRIRVIAGLFRLIVDFFARVLEIIERLLFAVDEWLRFRSGENRITTSTKIVLGIVWLFVHYIVRFCVNLLIEPQINPIKHFPVVTVSHKIILPFQPELSRWLVPFIGKIWAPFIAAPIVLALPGIFGFLVWELKENWRLYAANRTPNLKPIMVGHHGEAMLQFMKPGFRSGTLPKLYARLRRAGRKAIRTGNWKATGKPIDALQRVEEHVRWFVDRELLSLLTESGTWAPGQLASGEIKLGTNCILIELYCPDLSEESLWLRFEERSGWLVSSVGARGWLNLLSERQREGLTNALAGFYKMAGVHLVREQIEARIPTNWPGYDVTENGLVVTTADGRKVLYVLHDGPVKTVDEMDSLVLADDDPARFVFAANPISWRRWVTTWRVESFDRKFRALEGICILPGGVGRA